MPFNTLTFVGFFAVVLALYWSIPSWPRRKDLLLAASYLFYASWNPPFALLLFATSAFDYFAAARMALAGEPGRRRRWLLLSLASNLSMLGFFKYGNFLLENWRWLLARFGVDYHPPRLALLLPLGISFYTFHSLSYTLDVYRGTFRPTRSFRDFLLAISFFPQLVAGPIVRAADFLPQCEAPPRPDRDRFLWGLWLLTLGLFDKIVLADGLLAPAVDAVYGAGRPLSGADAWLGVVGFASQLFLDFAGYSACAIGAALCLGFHLKDNFRWPFASADVADFWNRWHISLSTFMRDYVYLPLGRGRSRMVRAVLAPLIVMLLVGLWHGAAWRFVLWGGINGIFLVADLSLSRIRGFESFCARSAAARLARGLFTLALLFANGVFFRSQTLAGSLSIFRSLAQLQRGANVLTSLQAVQIGAVFLGLLSVHHLLKAGTIEAAVTRLRPWMVSSAWAVMACAILLAQGTSNAFIYFQF